MAIDPRAYKLELSQASDAEEPAATPSSPSTRPSLRVLFACCGIYTHVYRTADTTAYRGRCPRCGRPVSFRVGPGGTDSRFFVVH